MSLSSPLPRPDRRQIPSVDGLEERHLLTAVNTQSYLVQRAWHKYHQYVSELQKIELKSRATPAESLALSDSARAISAAASVNPGPAPQEKALAVTIELDRAPLYGWMGPQGWAQVGSRITADLQGLNVPTSLIDQALASMHAVATSAGVTSSDYDVLSAKEKSYQDARSAIRNTLSHFPDPDIYYTQHLRGFFRGQGVQRRQGDRALNSNLRSIETASNDTPAQTAVLRRDAKLLQQVGVAVTSQTNQQFGDAYVAAFAQGAPTSQEQSSLQAQFVTILGPGISPTTLVAANQLVADSDAFYQAAGSSQENVQTITLDVRTYVENGGGAPLNPYKVQIVRTPVGNASAANQP